MTRSGLVKKFGQDSSVLIITRNITRRKRATLDPISVGHDSEYRTPAALYVESCYCFEKKMKS